MPQVVSLLSSSPTQPASKTCSPSPPNKRPYSGGALAQNTDTATSRPTPSPTLSLPLEDPFQSDDDFSLAEVTNSRKANGGPVPKRQRVSGKESNTTTSSTWYQNSFTLNLTTLNDDAVDLTSENIELPTIPTSHKSTSSWRDKEKRPETLLSRQNIDDIASSSPAIRQQANKPQPKSAAWDPISSSAPNQPELAVISLDDSDSEDEFPDINRLSTSKPGSRRPDVSTSTVASPAKATAKAKATTSKPKQTAEEKAKEKEEKAAAREAERERKRLEKERAKEERAKDRQKDAALAEVNKLRTSKTQATPEMIVELPRGLNPTVKYQTEALLADLKVEVRTFASPVDNVVRWARKVDSKFNQALSRYEPVSVREEREPYALALVSAQEFVAHALNDTLSGHVEKINTHFPDAFAQKGHLIYLIEGLRPFLRSSRNAANRQFAQAVRSELDPASSSSSIVPPTSSAHVVTEDKVDQALLELQLKHSAIIHETDAPVETSDWISRFTQHIGTAPYRRQKELNMDSAANFCMETGQVETGDDAKDTYVKILQQITFVNKPIAYGIANEFESVSKLVRGFEMGGDKILRGVRKSANSDGTFTDRLVGDILSKRVCRVFTSRDVDEEDV